MSIFLSFFGIPPYKFLLDNLLYLIPFFMPCIPPSQTFTLAIFLLALFFGKILAFLGVNSTFCWLGDSFIQTRTVYYSVPHENQSLSVFHRHFPIENGPGLILMGDTLIYYTGISVPDSDQPMTTTMLYLQSQAILSGICSVVRRAKF